MYDKKYVITTCNRKLTCVKEYLHFLNTFYKFNFDLKIIKIEKIKVYKPMILSMDEVFKVIKLIKKEKYKYIFRFLYIFGLRVSELCNLTLKNLDLSNLLLIVKGKNKRIRILYMSNEVANDFKYYLNSYHFNIKFYDSETLEYVEYIFNNNKGNKLSTSTIYRLVKTNCKEVLKKDVSPHTLRHSLATHMINENIPIEEVRDFLGHTSLDITELYVHKNIEREREMFIKTFDKIAK